MTNAFLIVFVGRKRGEGDDTCILWVKAFTALFEADSPPLRRGAREIARVWKFARAAPGWFMKAKWRPDPVHLRASLPGHGEGSGGSGRGKGKEGDPHLAKYGSYWSIHPNGP